MTSTTLQRIDEHLSGLDPESLRARVLMELRRFRAGWIGLGRRLNEIAYGGDYKEWGYDDFEIYCARELGLKKPTVQKLMVSYNYMKSNEAQRLHDYENASTDDSAPAIPDYQTVDLLARARKSDGMDDTAKEELHRRVFAPENSSDEDEAALRRELRNRLRPPSSPAWEEGANPDKKALADILGLSRKLRKLVAASAAIPDELRGKIEDALIGLEAL